jgi:hypothetical protein
MSAIGDRNQEVLIALKLVVDQGNAAIAKQISDQVKQAAQGAYQVFEQSSQKQVQLAGTTATRVMRIHEDMATKIQRIDADAAGKGFEAQVAAAQKVERLRIDMATRISRVEQDAAARSVREQEAAAQAAERQADKRERSLANQETAQEKLQQKLIHGYMGLGESVLHVAKGVALLAGAEEKNVEKLDEMFPKWKAMSDIVSGSIHFYAQIGEMLMVQKELTQSLVAEQRLLNAERAAGAAIDAGAAGGVVKGGARSTVRGVEKGAAGGAGAEAAGTAIGVGAGPAGAAAIRTPLLITALAAVKGFIGSVIGAILGPAGIIGAIGAAIILATFELIQWATNGKFLPEVKGTLSGAIGKMMGGWANKKWGYNADLIDDKDIEEHDKELDRQRAIQEQAREKSRERDELHDRLREGTVGNFLTMQRGWAQSDATLAQNALSYAVGKSISEPGSPRWQEEIGRRQEALQKAKLAAEAPDLEELREAQEAKSSVKARMQPSLVRGTGATQENYEALGRAQEKVAEIQKRILENRRHETAELYNQLGAARSLVQAEKDRLQDRQVAFGKMDPGRQHAMLAVLHKIKAAHEITDSEANLMDESGFSDQTRQHWLRKAAKADPTGLLAATVGKGIDAAKKEEERVSKELAKAKAAELEATEKLAKTIQEIFDTKGTLLGLTKGDIDKDIHANKEALGELGKALQTRDRALRDEIRRVAQRLMAGVGG